MNDFVGAEQGARDKVQDVMGKLIFQAGVDYEYVLSVITSCKLIASLALQDKTNVRECAFDTKFNY
jgi:hypothetical protein